MYDTDFQEPAQKTLSVNETLPCGRSKLAVISLVFGILGLTALPLVGSLIALVTGLAALSEIRTSRGRISGRAMAKAGVWLAVVWVFVAVVAAGIVALVVGYQSVEMTPPAATVQARVSGVKMANELGTLDMNELKRLGVDDQDEAGDLICYYTNDAPNDGEPESAAVTSKQVVFMKGDRKTAFDLKEVDAMMDAQEYRAKYTPQVIDTTRFMIEVKRRSGARMRIAIRPYQDGPMFYSALEEAWKAAGGQKAPAINVPATR